MLGHSFAGRAFAILGFCFGGFIVLLLAVLYLELGLCYSEAILATCKCKLSCVPVLAVLRVGKIYLGAGFVWPLFD